MRLPCPFCGERDAAEFVYRGDAAAGRLAENADDFERVYLRDNPAGPFAELWYHAQGCRSWIEVTRDTRTHEVLDAVLAVSGR